MKKNKRKISLSRKTVTWLTTREQQQLHAGAKLPTRPIISCQVYCGPPPDDTSFE